MGRWYSQVGEVLDDWGGMFRRSGLPTGLMPVWAEVVGEDAAVHCRPVRLTRKGVLTIAVSDGGWSQELSYLQPEILTKLQEIQDKPIVSLRFHLAPRTFQPREPKENQTGEELPSITMEEFENAARIATTFKNGRIRDTLLSALMRRLKPGGW